MKLRILRALLKKELILMRKNPFIPRIIIAMPIVIMSIIPLVATLEVKDVGVVVIDNDRSQLSFEIISDLAATGFLKIEAVAGNQNQAIEYVEYGKADVILTIPEDYSKNFGKVNIDANGVNATKGMLGANYVAQSLMNTLSQYQKAKGVEVPQAQISVVNRFNPTLDFKNYMIPALIVVLLIIICGFLPTLNIVSEKEEGTLDAMNVTPVSKFTFVISKLIPYWIAGVIVVTIGMIVGWAIYGLAPMGNILLIYLATIIFSLVMSSLGVWIANQSSTMLQSIFVMFAFIMVFQLMGGLFTPIQSMPDWAQYITYAIPPRYFIEIMRSVYLKGTALDGLWLQFGALAAFAFVLSLIAALSYKKQS